MQRNRKVAILIVFMTVAIFVWIPKGTRGKKAEDVSPDISSAAFDQTIPLIRTVPRKRTEFVDWGRNPFTFPQGEKKRGSLSNLKILCIMAPDEGGHAAVINESIVRVGDKINDKTVKQIEQNRVILTDGTKDYVLELRE